MNLTSLRRVKYALGQPKADQDHILSRLVSAASTQIVHYLRRRDQAGGDALQLKSRTEYLDPIYGKRVYYPRAFPIQSVTTLHSDSTGRYDGDETLVDATGYLIGSDSRSLTFSTSSLFPDFGAPLPRAPRGARLVYIAGLAHDPVISTWTKGADVGGSLTVGHYILGADSLSVGRITAASASGISYECLAGVFTVEQIKEYKELDGRLQDGGLKDESGVTATLTAVGTSGGISQLSLAEAEPALVEACEMHVAHLWKNRGNFDNIIDTRDGGNRASRADLQKDYHFLPEVRAILEPYRNRLVI